MAFKSYLWGLYFSVLVSASSKGEKDHDIEVVQPQDTVSVQIGGTLKLGCTVTGSALPGPVKWFLGEGPSRKLVYTDTESSERVVRNNDGSNTDFTILIRNVSLEDTGTYYCVKHKKDHSGDKDLKSGRGTKVVVTENGSPSNAQDYVIPAAAGAACVLLAALVFAAVYFYAKKKRGRNCRTSRSAEPLPVNTRTPNQPSGDKELVYADLKDPSGLKRPKQSDPEPHSEYATIRVPQSVPG